MSLTVIAPCYFPGESHARALVESCRALALDFHGYGWGRPFEPHGVRSHIVEAIMVLATLDSSHVLFTDARDAVVLAPEGEIMKLFDLARGLQDASFVYSVERNCWPQSELAPRFPGVYPNAGGWIGLREPMINVLKLLRDTYTDDSFEQACNPQARTIQAMADGLVPVSLDTQSRIFQTMSGERLAHWRIRGRRFENKNTGARPAVVHYNGHSEEGQTLAWQLYEATR